jgi:putative methionine-R-sulfoxide reductase with GAF domain
MLNKLNPRNLYSIWHRVILCLSSFVFCIMLFSANLLGQAYTAHYYSLSEQNSFSSINGFTKDAQGYMWLAADNGIYKFDGKSYTKVSDASYDAIHALPKGQVYALQDLSLVCVDTNMTSCDLQIVEQVKLGEYSGDNILNTDFNACWILGTELYLIDSTGISSFEVPISDTGNIFLASFQKSPLLVTSSGQTHLLNRASGSFERYASLQFVDGLTSVQPYRRHDLILASGKRMLFARWDKNSSSFQLSDIAQDVEGYLVAGDHIFFYGQNGDLQIASPFRDGFKVSKVYNFNGFHNKIDLSIGSIKSMYYDRYFESIWILTDEAIVNLVPLKFERLHDNITAYEITSIAILSNGFGYSVAGGNIFQTRHDAPNYATERLEFDETIDNAFALAGMDDRLWFSTFSNALYAFEDGAVQDVIDLNDRGGLIFYLFGDSQNNLWVSQSSSDRPIVGVLKVEEDGRLIEYNEDDGLQTRILVTTESPNGIVYCAGGGTTTYLYKFDGNTQKFVNMSLPLTFDTGESFEVHDLTMDSDSVFWLATTSGLLKQTPNTITNVNIAEVRKNEVVAVQMTQDRILWASTDTKGVIRYNTANDHYVFYDINSGLPSNLMFYRSMEIEPGGKVWIGTSEGVVMNVPGEPLKVQKPIITSLQINGKNSNLASLSDNLPFRSDVSFKIQSLTYPREGVNYSYLLEGGISTWVQLENQDSLRLEDLDRGNYTINFKAEHTNGFEVSDILTISFTVNDVWYKRTWVVIAFLILVFFVAILGSRHYSRNLRREKAILEEEKSDLKKKLEQEMLAVEEKVQAFKKQEQEYHGTNWVNKYLAEFSKLISEHKDDVKSMNSLILGRLFKLLHTSAGIIFLKENMEGDSKLVVSSTFGVENVEKFSALSFEVGEGMVGVALEEGETKVYGDDLPEDYFRISSSLGVAKPRELIVVPIVFEELKIGVIELASFQKFEPFHIEFLQRLAQLMGSKILLTLSAYGKGTQ